MLPLNAQRLGKPTHLREFDTTRHAFTHATAKHHPLFIDSTQLRAAARDGSGGRHTTRPTAAGPTSTATSVTARAARAATAAVVAAAVTLAGAVTSAVARAAAPVAVAAGAAALSAALGAVAGKVAAVATDVCEEERVLQGC
jgi:hypothetical protein